ncbi:hypothetical protein MLD38_008288 [Melastoma candidum]|uniref:Uncharacterized protein n=1 Tax=Melastoma candidum TaxID=119954 RepID=A0ACB9RY51_9MYRT|nr:hypothetical protein MLD38_008288 [Melastoma candidum]
MSLHELTRITRVTLMTALSALPEHPCSMPTRKHICIDEEGDIDGPKFGGGFFKSTRSDTWDGVTIWWFFIGDAAGKDLPTKLVAKSKHLVIKELV